MGTLDHTADLKEDFRGGGEEDFSVKNYLKSEI